MTIIYITLPIFFCPTALQAQEAILTGGGDALGSGGFVSYSIGQVVYTTNSGINGTEAQGVQVPYEISIVQAIENVDFLKTAKINKTGTSPSNATIIENAKFINLKCNVYPNPTSDNLTLIIESFDTENLNLSYQLFSINGKHLESKKVGKSITSISMGNLIPATYILNVIHDNKSIKIFKIVKK